MRTQVLALACACSLLGTSCLTQTAVAAEPILSPVPAATAPRVLDDEELDTATGGQILESIGLFCLAYPLACEAAAAAIAVGAVEAAAYVKSKIDPPGPRQQALPRREQAAAFLATITVLGEHPQLRQRFADLARSRPSGEVGAALVTAALSALDVMRRDPVLARRLADSLGGDAVRDERVRKAATFFADLERTGHGGHVILATHPQLRQRYTDLLRGVARPSAHP